MKYYFFSMNGTSSAGLFDELNDKYNVRKYVLGNNSDNFFRKLVYKIHTSLKINSYLDLPFKYKYYENIGKELSDDSVIVMPILCAAKLGKNGLNWIKNKFKNIKLVLMILDSFNAHSRSLFLSWDIIKGYKFDLILSSDKDDCRKFGFEYMGYNYYSMYNNIIASNVESDIYYIGRNKLNDGRLIVLYEVCKYIEKKVNTLIRLQDTIGLDDRYKHSSMMIIKENIPYKQVVSEVMSSNCILEILQDGQQMQTLRYFEAVCYNKKLLTNNPEIVNLPYYDSRYMKVFSKPEDIDIEWVNRRENIDYGYKGDFSPVGILDIIEKKLGRVF